MITIVVVVVNIIMKLKCSLCGWEATMWETELYKVEEIFWRKSFLATQDKAKQSEVK